MSTATERDHFEVAKNTLIELCSENYREETRLAAARILLDENYSWALKEVPDGDL